MLFSFISLKQICCPETLNICLPGFPCDPEEQKKLNAQKCYMDDYGDECCAGDDGIEECYPVGKPFQCDKCNMIINENSCDCLNDFFSS